MSNVFNKGDRVTIKGLNGVVTRTGIVDDFNVDLDNGSKINFPGGPPDTKLFGIDATKADVIKVSGAPAPTTSSGTLPTRPSAPPTVPGTLPSRPIDPVSSIFKLSPRPSGRRSYDIDKAVAPGDKSTTVPPPVFRSSEYTLSFLTPRKPGCATKAAGAV